MPLYEYRCADGHVHNRLRAIAVRDEAVECDTCGASAVREVSAPRIAVLTATNRRAHERNERSAHEPRRHTRGEPLEAPRAKPAAACGHTHSHAHQGRPWMLGH